MCNRCLCMYGSIHENFWVIYTVCYTSYGRKNKFARCYKATAYVGSAGRVCLTAGLLARSQCASGRSCDRPPDTDFRDFPRSHSKCRVIKIHVALHVSHAALLKINSKIFTKAQPCQRDQNFVIMLHSRHQIRPKCSHISSPAYFQQSTSLQLTIFTSQCFSLNQPTFSRRTKGGCLSPSQQYTFPNPL